MRNNRGQLKKVKGQIQVTAMENSRVNVDTVERRGEYAKKDDEKNRIIACRGAVGLVSFSARDFVKNWGRLRSEEAYQNKGLNAWEKV